MTLKQIRYYAIKKHELMDHRYGGAPYSDHLERVVKTAQLFIEYIDPEEQDDVIGSCWAHDLIEDTGVTLKELESVTNKRVADIVFCVSNELGRTRKERNFKTYPKIWSNPLAVFVKCCDRLVNGEFSKRNSPELFERYLNEYPVFRYALYETGPYPKLWEALDNLFMYSFTNAFNK